jgi:hypothetical protein
LFSKNDFKKYIKDEKNSFNVEIENDIDFISKINDLK